MTHLNIQQGSNVEIVSAQIIKKLYDTALTVSEPLEGETDAAYMSGNLQVNKASRKACTYLTTRFPNLHINVIEDYYIDFEDSILGNRLISLCSSDGVGVTETDAANATFSQMDLSDLKNDVTSFNEFGYFTKANGNWGNENSRFRQFKNLTSIDLTNLQYLRSSDFRGTGITTVNAPSLIGIAAQNGNFAFQDCTSLTTVQSFGSITFVPESCFRGCTSLTTFPFNNITEIKSNAFNGCSNLATTIDLTNVTEIGQNAFRNTKIQVTGTPSANINIGSGAFYLCSNLTSFDFSNITTLNDSVFYESGLSGVLSIPNLTGVLNGAEFYKCTGLTSITNLGSITSITDSPYTSGGIVMGSFLNCTGLTSVTIPSTVTKIGYNAFSGCTNLSQVNCSWQNVIEVGQYAFSNHADWNFIVNLSNLTTLGKEAFGGYRSSKKIRQLYIPKIVNTDSNSHYQNYVYYSGTFTGITADIIYLRDLQSLHPGDFAYTTCTALVINNTTPPVWKNKDDLTDEETTNSQHTKDKVFGGSTITNIYVPDSAVTTYQNDANWSSVADKIQPLSNLTKVATEANLQANQVALIEAYM